MAVLGLILLLAAGGLTLDVVIQNTSSINVNALGQTFTLSPGWLFIAGLVAGAVGLLAVTMIVGGLARSHRRRVVLAETRGSVQDLQAERDQLAGGPLPRAGSQDRHTRGSGRRAATRTGDGRACRGTPCCDRRHDAVRWACGAGAPPSRDLAPPPP